MEPLTQPLKKQNSRNRKLFEIVWWLLTGIIAILVISPIYNTSRTFPYFYINIIFIVAFITLFRYVFFLRYTFLARKKYLKIILVFVSIPLVFYLISNLNEFITETDAFSLEHHFSHLGASEMHSMIKYVRSQMLFFGVASIAAGILFPFRLISSLWRQRNRGTV